jgi:hypothetical protein
MLAVTAGAAVGKQAPPKACNLGVRQIDQTFRGLTYAKVTTSGPSTKGGHAMGRGRQKAKATKQARDIKYYSPNTDYSALQRELTGPGSRATSHYANEPVEPDYSAYVDKYADDLEEDDDEVDTRRIG